MPRQEILEFSFWGANGRAVGRVPIIVLALLMTAAITAIAVFPLKFGILSGLTWVARIRGP